MGVSGIEKLGGLRQAIRKLGAVPAQAATEAATLITQELKGEFAKGVDPYGRQWAPLQPTTRRRKGHARPMIDSGLAKSSTAAKPLRGVGIALQTDADYLRFHQGRSGTRPARPVFPTGVLPREWNRAITQAVDHAVKAVK
jgi:hypothetical protein